MDANKNMNQKDLKPWLAFLGMFIGIFTALMATFLDVHGMNLWRGLSIAGLVLFVGIIVWLFFRVLHTGAQVQFTIVIVLYLISAGFFLWMGTWLASRSSAAPAKSVTSYDFESRTDLEGWGEEAQLSSEHSFDGEKALKALLPISPDEKTTFYLHWKHEFEADVVVGQIYWPDQDGILLEWVQVCVPFEDWSCTFISKEPGWNTFVLDLSEMKTLEGQSILSDLKLPGLVLQGVLQTANADLKSFPVYLDAMQIYVDGHE